MSADHVSPIRVLIAEDEEHLGAILEHFLRGRGYTVKMCRDGRAALTELHAVPYDVALIDIVMPQMDGLEVLRHLQNEPAPPEVIIITGNGTIDTAITAIKLGAYDYISKPYRMAEIDVMVRRAWEKRELGKANLMLRSRTRPLPRLVATRNPVMRTVLERLPDIARLDTPVMIQGERGTGKSHVARYIHHLSGLGSDSLIEVQQEGGMLVGGPAILGRQGVPSGAGVPTGALLAADRGTVVVDASALDEGARAVLHELLRDRSFRRIGGSTIIPITSRLVVCVEDARDAGRFADLADLERITIPPLRSRTEDLATLAAELLAEQVGPPHTIAAEAVAVLAAYTWPGNVRELGVVLTRCALLASRENISAGDLRLLLATGAVGVEGRGAPLADLEKLHIEAMLVRFHWHQGRAAEALGISTKTLYRKMREFGFRRPRKRKLARVRPEG
ncbi:MAG: response regulator [Gemmatimonadota bacterium]|nr:response regulator [Gemmatimonadota bacterium]